MSDLLAGLRVFVVEDESIIAMLIADMLEEMGCSVVAIAPAVPLAKQMAANIEADLAVLDVNIAGEWVFPVAETLRDRGLPLVFSTGYGAFGLPEEWKNRPVVAKPFELETLRQALLAAVRGAR